MFDHFSTSRRKGLNYNFQKYFKGIISIHLCKTVNLWNVETLQSKQNLFKVCSKILISKNSYHYRKPIDWFLNCTEGYFWKDYRKLQNIWEIRNTLSLYMKNVIINLYTSSYGTRLFFLVIEACPTILPENPSPAHTWTIPNIPIFSLWS